MFICPVDTKCVWQKELCPIGHESFRKESFDDYWLRNRDHFHGLPADLVEQWVFRYFCKHPHSYIPLSSLTYSRQKMTPADFMRLVKSATDNCLDPEWDYEVFHKCPGGHPTSDALDRGRWDYPPILLSVPNGFHDGLKSWPDAKYILIEGHQRRRYLNALIHRGVVMPAQEVLLLESPIVDMLVN